MYSTISLADSSTASAGSYGHTDWWLVSATFLLCVITAALAWYTANLFRVTSEIAGDSSSKSRAQLRSYITVSMGESIVQEAGRSRLFQGRARITNAGLTPAKSVQKRVNAAILSNPLPSGFDFPLPEPVTADGPLFLGPQQFVDVYSALLDEIPENEVMTVARGTTRAFYFWGAITYEDFFGASHETKFCHMVTWPDFPTSTNVSMYFITKFAGMT